MSTTLHQLIIKNFKQFDDIEIELGNTVVFVGPNNSGKTTALQALSLWQIGIETWQRKKNGNGGRVPVNRLDLTAIPNTTALMLWRNLITHKKGSKKEDFDIQIIVEGITDNKLWQCGMIFQFDNEEAFYCQPIKGQTPPIPDGAKQIKVAFLPPMSGLALEEPLLQMGRIQVLIGEGQTAQIIRNLCYTIYENNAKTGYWDEIVRAIEGQFHITLQPPIYNSGRGTIEVYYKTPDKVKLDLLSSGSGMRQTLLLLLYLYLNPNTMLLLDEPDAHLEVLRQKSVYHLITTIAKRHQSKLLIASHSETILEESAENDLVIAFLGKPHRMNQLDHVKRALREFSFVDYHLAEQMGWILYLEGSTDLAILRALAQKLNHAVIPFLEHAFNKAILVKYLDSDRISIANKHFYALREEAIPHLIGILIVDNPPNSHPLSNSPHFRQLKWSRREIENYIAIPEGLSAYAGNNAAMMNQLIQDQIPPVAMRDRNHDWWKRTKMSDDFLDPLFEAYYQALGLPNLMRKTNYHILADYLTPDQIHPEIIEKLDAIYEVAKRAKPRE
jgi:energy-coupling factor transporter ATP-binding protein EcfA2